MTNDWFSEDFTEVPIDLPFQDDEDDVPFPLFENEKANAAPAAAAANVPSQAAGNTSVQAAAANLLARADKGELSVEEAFAALDQLIKRMEDEGISLEDSFSCYETGIRLVRYCNERIDRVEKKVQMLRGEGQAPLDNTVQ